MVQQRLVLSRGSSLTRRVPCAFLLYYFLWLIMRMASLVPQVVAFNIVIAGGGGGTAAPLVQLLTGKLATQAGDTCHILSSNDPKGLRSNRALMYGTDHADDPEKAQSVGPFFISTPSEIGDALANADGLIFLCTDDGKLEPSRVDIMLNNVNEDKCSHVVLLSQIGGVYKSIEQHVRTKCQERLGEDTPCSIVRTGILKGGGPGDVKQQYEWGLDKFYYNTILKLTLAMNEQSFDKFTLGAVVSPGDPFKSPNFFQKFNADQSFDPADQDTGRIAAANAMLQIIKRPTAVDITLSSASGREPPTPEEWKELLDAVVV